MSAPTTVATANVLRTLDAADARTALGGLLALAPDLIGLQEWGPTRLRLLLETGSVRLVPRIGPGFGPGFGRADTGRAVEYVWVSALVGGCVVGARADRFELLEGQARILGRLGRADRGVRRWGVRPPRFATVGTFRDRERGRTVSIVSYHLTPAVQRAGAYRDDRPRLTGAHRRELRELDNLVAALLARGNVVYAVGDSNFDGLRLTGLTSAWDGREGEPGTHGQRKIDDVHGAGRPVSVTTLSNGSDHLAVVAERAD